MSEGSPASEGRREGLGLVAAGALVLLAVVVVVIAARRGRRSEHEPVEELAEPVSGPERERVVAEPEAPRARMHEVLARARAEDEQAIAAAPAPMPAGGTNVEGAGPWAGVVEATGRDPATNLTDATETAPVAEAAAETAAPAATVSRNGTPTTGTTGVPDATSMTMAEAAGETPGMTATAPPPDAGMTSATGAPATTGVSATTAAPDASDMAVTAGAPVGVDERGAAVASGQGILADGGEHANPAGDDRMSGEPAGLGQGGEPAERRSPEDRKRSRFELTPQLRTTLFLLAALIVAAIAVAYLFLSARPAV